MDKAGAALTKIWLETAEEDLKAAEIISAAAGGPLSPALYHCQQAAEKAVKAFLVSRDEPFAKKHEIEPLVEKAAEFEPGFLQFQAAAAFLTPLAWQFRYPSGLTEGEPDTAQLREALRQARSIYEFVLSVLPPEARP